MSWYDVVVVGAGASGSTVASRLSEDPDRSVLLLEAGHAPMTESGFPSVLLDGSQVPGAQAHLEHHWSYPVQLAEGRPYTVLRGRVLGGSTTTNGGYFVRARRDDFGAWSAAGNPAWSYDSLLPFLRRLEKDLDYGATPIHGDSGPIPVRRPSLDTPSATAFAAAAQELGHPLEADKNDQGAAGFGAVPLNVNDGVRWNTGLAYVIPALSRPNFTLIGDCTVHRILMRGTRAEGVEFDVAGTATTVETDCVVVSAGVFESPRLLMRSGMGPASRLRQLGIPVVWDLPGVGRRFSDHPQVVVNWMPRPGAAPSAATWITAALNFCSDDGPASGDLQILQSTVPLGVLMGGSVASPDEPLPFLVSVNTPVASGALTLTSPEIGAPLRIDYRYLSSSADRARLRAAVRETVDLVMTKAFSAVSVGLHGLDAHTAHSDTGLDEWIRSRLGTALHACGTAPMGPVDDPSSVVDQHGRVHHLSGLRIADTSILPAAPLRGPAATAVLIGEVIAASLCET